MTKIEVPGTFLFENGKVSFAFADKTVAFSDIASMDQFRAVLVAIAQHSTQKSIEQILHAGQPADLGHVSISHEAPRLARWQVRPRSLRRCRHR